MGRRHRRITGVETRTSLVPGGPGPSLSFRSRRREREGDKASACGVFARRVAIGLDRRLWYATCEGDGTEIGRLIIIAHNEWNRHASRIHHHRSGRDFRAPPGLRGERPDHGSRPRGPGSDGGRRPDPSSDLPKAPPDDPEIVALRRRELMAPASHAPEPSPPEEPVVPNGCQAPSRLEHRQERSRNQAARALGRPPWTPSCGPLAQGFALRNMPVSRVALRMRMRMEEDGIEV